MFRIVKKLVNKSLISVVSRKYSLPAYDDTILNKYYTDNIPRSLSLDHGYVCPLCKGSGIILCKLCKEGCLYCGYSKFILCRCQLDI